MWISWAKENIRKESNGNWKFYTFLSRNYIEWLELTWKVTKEEYSTFAKGYIGHFLRVLFW